MKYAVLDRNTMISSIFMCQKYKNNLILCMANVKVMKIGEITMFLPFKKNIDVEKFVHL